ncbi:MAG: c-type cytochrome [Deltaproteobacteria bacterium]|nr:c-type cytochrome [Deltaproteobacteria bacterium]
MSAARVLLATALAGALALGCGEDKPGAQSAAGSGANAPAPPPPKHTIPAATAEQAATFEKEQVVQAVKQDALPTDEAALAAALEKAPAVTMLAYRQRTVELMDRDVNKALETLGPREVQVRALVDSTTLLIAASWDDASAEELAEGESTHFGDAAALELPQKFGAGESLPYVGMGDEGHPVVVTIVRARKEKPYARQFVAAGFGSLTRIEPDTEMTLRYDEAAHRWNATWKRPLKDNNVDLDKGLVPFALALWDGGVRERGGNKSVSSWHFLRLPERPLDQAYLRYVAWGQAGEPIGDASRGKTLLTVCAACHRLGETPTAKPGIAPGLDNIGGYALPQYLRESIVDPNAVVVRQVNINRHYDKAKGKSPHGDYPKNTTYNWYSGGGHGADEKPRISKMPPFASLPEKDVFDIVAYLQTLKTPHGSKP